MTKTNGIPKTFMKTTDFWIAFFLATGTMVGVGLLAVPILVGLVGLIPGLALTLLAAATMWLSGVLIAERSMDLRIENGDIASLYAADIGRWVKWIVMPVYLLLFYILLVAYLTAGAGIFSSLTQWDMPNSHWILLTFIFCSVFMVFGHNVMLNFNGIIVTLMMGSFVVMLFASTGNITAANLTRINLPLAPFALPVLCCAFAYHNVIPLICRRLNNDRRTVHLALTFALLTAFVLTATWLIVVTGSLPYNAENGVPSLLAAYQDGLPATVPISRIAGSRLLPLCAVTFSVFAVLTSYIGIGAALSSFLRDICAYMRPVRRAPLLFATVFLPPLALAILKPDIFLDMLDLAGGFGVIILFGILPAIAFAKTRTTGNLKLKGMLLLMLLFYIFVFAVEAAKLLNLYKPVF